MSYTDEQHNDRFGDAPTEEVEFDTFIYLNDSEDEISVTVTAAKCGEDIEIKSAMHQGHCILEFMCKDGLTDTIDEARGEF